VKLSREHLARDVVIMGDQILPPDLAYESAMRNPSAEELRTVDPSRDAIAGTRITPPGHRIYRYLRIPIFLASLLALAGSSYTLVRNLQGDPVIDVRHPFQRQSAKERAAQAAQARSDYRDALLADALDRFQREEYENARIRLDEASAIDPSIETSGWVPDVRTALAYELGETAEASPASSLAAAEVQP
jgi:hypothetical protein